MTSSHVLIGFKAVLYSLLVANIFLFLAEASPTKAIDEIGWLLLLGVFEWETRRPDAATWKGWPLIVELTGYALAIYAFVDYGLSREWLDLGNSAVWLLISALIVLDIVRPVAAGARGQQWRTLAKGSLYLATFGFALAWGITGVWLDFWDAMLWILCFFVIEINIFRLELRRPPAIAAGA